jgi:hypothetical protein
VTRLGWNAIFHTVASGIALAAFAGWLSTRDAAREAYSLATKTEVRVQRLEDSFDEARIRGELTHSEIPRIQAELHEIKLQQRWLQGVLYDLARALKPTLPIDPPPVSEPPAANGG